MRDWLVNLPQELTERDLIDMVEGTLPTEREPIAIAALRAEPRLGLLIKQLRQDKAMLAGLEQTVPAPARVLQAVQGQVDRDAVSQLDEIAQQRAGAIPISSYATESEPGPIAQFLASRWLKRVGVAAVFAVASGAGLYGIFLSQRGGTLPPEGVNAQPQIARQPGDESLGPAPAVVTQADPQLASVSGEQAARASELAPEMPKSTGTGEHAAGASTNETAPAGGDSQARVSAELPAPPLPAAPGRSTEMRAVAEGATPASSDAAKPLFAPAASIPSSNELASLAGLRSLSGDVLSDESAADLAREGRLVIHLLVAPAGAVAVDRLAQSRAAGDWQQLVGERLPTSYASLLLAPSAKPLSHAGRSAGATGSSDANRQAAASSQVVESGPTDGAAGAGGVNSMALDALTTRPTQAPAPVEPGADTISRVFLVQLEAHPDAIKALRERLAAQGNGEIDLWCQALPGRVEAPMMIDPDAVLWWTQPTRWSRAARVPVIVQSR
jgi:hypothetical protein